MSAAPILKQSLGDRLRQAVRLKRHAFAWSALLALIAAPAGAEQISSARFADPVERYGHFALGRPHEYARLVATSDAGRELVLELPADEVFEDLAPRVVSLAAGEAQEILAIVSSRVNGARLVMLRLSGDRLEISAQSAPIGTPMRWLNPVGVADLDGDGRAEIAAVITPHIGGTLKVYRRIGGELAEVASLPGFSNHVYGSAELALSAVVQDKGGARLVVPDAARRQLRIVALERGGLIELGRCALPSPVIGALRASAASAVSVGLEDGVRSLRLTECEAGRR